MSFSVSYKCHQPKDFIGPKTIGVFLNLSECLSQCLLSVISPKISLVQRLYCHSNVFLSVFLRLNVFHIVFLCVFVSVIIPKISLVQRFHWSKDFIGVFLHLSECLSQCLLSVISPKISLVQRFHWSRYFIGPNTLLVSF